jgi:hypothetical protein
MPRKTQAKYLGGLLSDTVDNKKELACRLADVNSTANKLKLFWTKAQTTIKWKLKVFDAILGSKLLYGLETIQLTEPEKAQINAFQIKCLRRILNVPPTHIDRTWTNKRVIEQLEQQHKYEHRPIATAWNMRKFKLLGHIIRAPGEDPLRQVVFETGVIFPRIEHMKRVGRPRANWVIETFNEAHRALNRPDIFDIENKSQMEYIIKAATDRLYIFETNGKQII